MPKPLMNERTTVALQHYLGKPSHALLLTGPNGAGKLHLASWLAHEMKMHPLEIKPATDKQTISIEQIRQLYTQTRGAGNVCVIIQDAHTMGREAQNAFLKLLEEPPQATRFILTATSQRALLPTISSRSQHVAVGPLSNQQLKKLAGDNLPPDTVTALLHTLNGRPGKLVALLEDEAELKRYQEVLASAKTFYTGTPYQRHLMLLENNFDKPWLQSLLDTLVTIIETLLAHKSDNKAARKKLLGQAALVEQAHIRIFSINGNPKIHATQLAQQL